MLIMAPTSGLLPVLLGSKNTSYDLINWVAIMENIKLSDTDMKANKVALRLASTHFWTKTPLCRVKSAPRR